jgi:ribosomal protein S18 acetylase RimI-like enzyme
MGLTYFKRYRMEVDVSQWQSEGAKLPEGFRLVAWDAALLGAHADVKYECFCVELDAIVFPCLGNREGCHRLMREITNREGFLAAATWLIEYRGETSRTATYCGTVQGVRDSAGEGGIQNLGITPRFRGQGLGTVLMDAALGGFRKVGVQRVHLEVTAQNTGAVRLYQRLGFRRTKTVYKAADVAYA